jgi:hypothetical protein
MFEADHTLGANRWPVIRLKSGRVTEIVLLSTRFFSLTTHWYKCTVPCASDDCPLCDLLPARGLFYLAVGCNSRISILELGSQSASYLEQHAKFCHKGLAVGHVYELSRKGDKRPVRSEYVRSVPDTQPVAHLDLATHVMALYKYPCPNPGEELETYERRCRSVARIRCERIAEQLVRQRERQTT